MLDLNKINKIVIKIGTAALTNEFGVIDSNIILSLAESINILKQNNKDIIIVSSGAVGSGMSKLNFKNKPNDIKDVQACASVGQCELIKIYDKCFSNFNITISQILLTNEILKENFRKTNVINTINSLLKYGCVPIVNENDCVSTDEINFGDNDILSSIVTYITKSDLLIIMSDINGLYNKDPHTNPDAKLISYIHNIDENINNFAQKNNSNLGRGGMASKLKAAEFLMSYNIPMYIINGKKPKLILDILNNKNVGTLFYKK